jgi:ADP-ribose pyrophosphatase
MIKKGPWQVKNSKSVYKNPWLHVYEDQVIQPNGDKGAFTVVEMKMGISVLVMDDTNNVYLTKEFKYGIGKESLETISGGIDRGEDKLEAAKRELKEELGIVAEEWIDLGVIDPFTSVVVSPNYMYLARKLKFSKPNPEGTEIIKILKIKFDEVVKLVMESKITHGASVAVILKAKNYLGF